jgi:SagB-type dehydrogenase family enzyme
MDRDDKGNDRGLATGEKFQEETKYDPARMDGHALDWDHRPEPLKSYPNPFAVVPLPDPEIIGDANIWKALQHRRSIRVFKADKGMPLGLFSSLLWATQGATARWGDTFFRTAPSAGGLYPVETYVSVRKVETLDAGIYHFRPGTFDLEQLEKGDASETLAAAALGQTLILDAQVTFIWSAVVARGTWKYRQRAYRYFYLDAGHIAQNLYLAGEALGLGVCAVGAFYDDEVNGTLGLDGTDETAIYMAAAGYPGEGV